MRHGLSRSIIAVVLHLVLLALPSPTQAARIRPINLEEMSERADRIFRARCVSVRVAPDPVLGQVVTYVTLTPLRVEKGDIHGSVTIKILGSQDADGIRGHATEGVPLFRKGEETILFLYGDSRHGLTSPVGFGQGKFSIVRDKQGRSLALNQLGNEHLLRGLSPAARKRLGDRAGKLEESREIAPDALLDLVHSLRP